MHEYSFACVVLVTSLGSACGSETDCTFEHVVSVETEGLALLDCGSLQGPNGSESFDRVPWRAAHDCVLAASAAQEPFVVRSLQPGLEGALKLAYVGRSVAGAWSLSMLSESYRPDASTRPAEEYECDALMDRGDCVDVTTTLCVSCVGKALVDRCGE
jgi:hypothetical protein